MTQMHTLFLKKSTKSGNEAGCGVVSVFDTSRCTLLLDDDTYGFQVLAAIFRLWALLAVYVTVCKDCNVLFPLGVIDYV